MGNTITKSSDDKRFGDSLFANQIKNIIMEQETMYRNNKIKLHLAKACCRDVIRPDINKDPNNVVSIAFPKALNLDDEQCAKNGKCLDISYVGLQVNDDKSKYCGNENTTGLAGYNFSTIRGDGGNSVCDNYMMD